jgi:hypothetical protein
MKPDELTMAVWKKNVPTEMLERLSVPHTVTTRGLPFAWMVSYRASGALQNLKIFQRGVECCKLEFPIRVFFSKWTDAIIVTFVPLEAIKEIHIMEWYYTFYEVSPEEAKERLEKYPSFPYDGRNPDTVRAEIIVNGGYQKFIDDARAKYKEQGIHLPETVNWGDIYKQDV